MTAYLNPQQILKYKEDITVFYDSSIRYDTKISNLNTSKSSAISKYDSLIATNEVLADTAKENLIKMAVNYFLNTGIAFSTDFPTEWDYIGLKTEGDMIILNGTTYHLSDLGRVNS